MISRAKTLTLPVEIGSLHEAQGFVRSQAGEMNVPESFLGNLELVVEELFVNIVNHARPVGRTEVEIRCELQASYDTSQEVFCLSVRDWGAPFNPLEQEVPSLETDLDDRPIGGLGIYLINQMTARCSYIREGDSNLFQAFVPVDNG
ncbi:ATP-binding protein [Desulfopila sp. IMCC35008]|uniref:ATP-binding protein n=1 Tax=Desulfopila sp. IMCC35008 TaxID=2653858 RepID=UPI0013D53976|nr:ATP-binding protein [Desulfopila sp. IMCC35008]